MLLKVWALVPMIVLTLGMDASGGVRAADAAGLFAAHGVGLARCSEFSRSVNMAEEDETGGVHQFVGWIGGYLTAANQFTPETYDIALFEDAQTIARYAKRYCDTHPDETFLMAIRRIVNGLETTRISEYGQPIPFGTPPVVALHPEAVEALSTALVSSRHLSDQASPPTINALTEALENFQADEGLPVTGLPDQTTLVRLIRNSASTENR